MLSIIHYVAKIGNSIFFGNEASRFFTPSPVFKGRTPISLLRKAEIDPVLETLASIESGAYS